MAKNRLFGWMFVEDSNKEPKPTVEPVKQEISVVVPTPTPPIVAAGDVDTKLVELLNFRIPLMIRIMCIYKPFQWREPWLQITKFFC